MAVGAILLVIASGLSGGRPMMAALATAMSMPAWWAVGIGLVLVVIHLMIRLTHKPSRETPSASVTPRKQASAIRALIDQAEMELLHPEAQNPMATTESHDPPKTH